MGRSATRTIAKVVKTKWTGDTDINVGSWEDGEGVGDRKLMGMKGVVISNGDLLCLMV